MKVIDKIALIHIKEGKVLCTLSKGKDKYYLPGGKREEGENNEQTLIRECREELSVEIDRESILYYDTFEAQAHGKEEGVIVQMTCYQAVFKGEPTPTSEIAEIAWLTSADMDKLSPAVQLIFKDLLEKDLIW